MTVDPSISFDLGGELSLVLDRGERGLKAFPTDGIAKAPSLSLGGLDLSEEGVGFGLPVVKSPDGSIFPGAVEYRPNAADASRFAIAFEMNLVERLSRKGGRSFETKALNLVKEALASIHRGLPFTRRALTAVSNSLRAVFGLDTRFVPVPAIGTILVEYRVERHSGRIAIGARADGLELDPATRIVLMNEAGAKRFDRYEDSSGNSLRGSAIETWRRVDAETANFIDGSSGSFFSAKRKPGATLYRGRELVKDRLSWAGLAYVLSPGSRAFDYEIEVGVVS